MNNSKNLSQNANNDNVALVFGAQVRANTPSDVLKKRLDNAADLYFQKRVSKLLLSGSNQSLYYNEPNAMKSYLIDKYNIAESDLILDYAGLRTLDSCYRAKTVFNVKKITLVTQFFHLPRAFFLCQQAGFESISTSIAADSTSGVTVTGYSREVFADWNAFIDVLYNESSTYKSDGTETIIN